ncbi:CHAT domain-containing protein [Leptothermofonsia sp. ETS-13]|uniref:CHAT domain-containing protein n=1 Tax=Leptothermofonsia sp. ETS-13 TaxID=3035696 RepID=UPI003B9FBF8A
MVQVQNASSAEAERLFQQGLQQAGARQFEAAIASWQQTLAIARKMNNRQLEGRTLINLGSAHAYLGRYQQALQFYQQTLNIAEKIGDRPTQVQALVGLGNIYFSRGQYQAALEFHQKAKELAQAINDPENLINALSGLGSIYNSLGLSQKAIPFYEQALAVARKSNDQQGIAIALGNLGIAHASLKQYTKAMDYDHQALRLSQTIKDPVGVVASLQGLGSITLAQRNFPDAIRFYEQALNLARQINDLNGVQIALVNLSNAYHAQGQIPKSTQSAQQAIELARQLGDREGEASALNNLGVILHQAGKPAEAETRFFAAIQIRESQRIGLSDLHKVSFIDTQQRAYRNLQRSLVAQNKIEMALEISERGRARAFVELLLRRQLSGASSDRIPILTIQKIKQIAREHRATLVEYSIIQNEYDHQLYIWVVKPTGEIAFRSVNLKTQPLPLNQLVTLSRESIGVTGRGGGLGVQPIDDAESSNQLQQLYQLLIQPIADQLPTDPDALVVFVPHSSLFLVPFPALEDVSGKPLIERHTILTSPSIQVLQLTRQKRQALPHSSTHPPIHPPTPSPLSPVAHRLSPALIVGNPTMPKVRTQVGEGLEQLLSLPGARQEAEEIANLLNTTFLTGNQATKATVVKQMPRSRLIHLATHGLLDDFKGLGVPGAIALAPAGQDNGLLTADEILSLQLNADLVVLSACDTGRGRITGDGVIGLSRSLISAGVPSVIVSLWAIPDAPTAFFNEAILSPASAKPEQSSGTPSGDADYKEAISPPLSMGSVYAGWRSRIEQVISNPIWIMGVAEKQYESKRSFEHK